MFKRYALNRVPRHSAPKRQEYEPIVQNGLAITPAEMMNLTNRGIPISPQNLGLVYDEGVSELDFTPPAEYTRGVEINDLWELRQQTRKKAKTAIDNHVASLVDVPANA